ncbi:MAG: magnesium transporter [Erysipelotrichaceae bacterium]|nr:magnesium transporter [Erysipelotrichaceae bacterium]
MDMEQNQNLKVQEIVELIKKMEFDDSLKLALEDYHDNDIADALAYLSPEERRLLYHAIGPERTGEVFSYLEEDVDEYIQEININEAAKIVEEMDTDDAVDLLEQIDDNIEEEILEKMDDKVEEEIRLIQSYDPEELGSLMTTNFIKMNILYTVKQAMRELIK